MEEDAVGASDVISETCSNMLVNYDSNLSGAKLSEPDPGKEGGPPNPGFQIGQRAQRLFLFGSWMQ